MHLHAIGIYSQVMPNGGSVIKRINYAQQDEGVFFASNQLENVEKTLNKPSFYSNMMPYRVYEFELDDEFQYFYKLNSQDAVLAISSRDKIYLSEINFLFQNIKHVLLRPHLGVTLKKIIDSPPEYIGRNISKDKKDILEEKLEGCIKEIITVMHKNIEAVIQRGERIEDLRNKAFHLDETAVKFQDKTKKLNSCCW